MTLPRNAILVYKSVFGNYKYGICPNYSNIYSLFSKSSPSFQCIHMQINQRRHAHVSNVFKSKTKSHDSSVLNTKHTYCSVQKQSVSTLYSLVQPMEVSRLRDVPKHIKKPSYVESGVVPPLGKRIPIKTKKQIEGIRSACSLARDILHQAGETVRAGVTTDEIDEIVHRLAIDNKAYPSPLQYKAFPKSVCTSVNNVACHGIPDRRALVDGDIINIDVTVYYNGYHGDCSKTYLVGNVDSRGQLLVDIARQCRDSGIAVCKPGTRFCDIGNMISDVATRAGLNIIPQFCGHGIGENFHELPDIFHFEHYDDKVMKQGMVFTVEPIICDGKPDIKILSDGWTAVTCDNSRSAQFEHTVLVTADGVEVLT